MDQRREIKYNRQSIRLKDHNYNRPGFYFVTICVNDNICCLGEIITVDEFIGQEICLSGIGNVVKKYLLNINNYYEYVALDKWVIMPNHLHMIIKINESADVTPVGAIHELPLPGDRRQMLLGKIIGKFKMNSARRINELMEKSGNSFWQRNYYEYIIRNEKSLERIRNYIRDNPRRWLNDSENPAASIK